MKSDSIPLIEAQTHSRRPDRESTPFADWLDGRLRTARISQRQLAMRAGVHHSTISRLVRQRRTPSFATAVRLAQVLDPTGTLPVARSGDAPSTSPQMRVEYALRSDPSLRAGDVRDLMRDYLRRRARGRGVASSGGPPVELRSVAGSRA
jgi:transcriptional regulator with XRE-family HTH domain